ncbi:hypothetical protein, conserved [Eimeria necatrix]|uniref:Uncharacterized protein n=1 Tax=Eimeria necatrix TaxID=51315 RepID=U6ML04_9EIME|nr:hypothetical protein, conserved [Eimeria necatrix]CDJ63753.1 hypothetical protein, conserved [Eimeria necatrix]
MGFDVFHATALGVTPLLSLCGATRPSYDSRDSLETSYDAEGHFGVVCNAARKEAEILRLLLLHCDELDRRYFRRPKPVLLGGNAVEISSEPLGHEEHSQASRRGETQDVKCTRLESRTRLLNACTHWLLSSSFAVHFAASKGKTKLCRQLLAAGCSIDALNYESATALHIACIEGHLGTAGLLLDHGANIDATTHRGESPLLLGAYKLHKDVCALLLERGADPSLVTRTEKLSVLHAVAAGVTRQVSMTFKGASWDRDGVTAALAGLGSNSDGLGIHWKTNSYAAVEAEVDLRLPSATPDSLDLFFSPKIMISRTAKAQELLLVFIKYCPSQLYRQHSRNGFTPANLLQRMWDDFVAKRARLLQINSLQLAGQTEDEKADALGGWEFLSHRMIVLKDLLSARLAPFSPVSGVAEYSSTPRVEDLEKQQKEQLAADAPWLFQKLLSKRASPEKQSPQQTVLQGKEQGKQG